MQNVYKKDGNQVNIVEENDLDSIKVFINPDDYSTSNNADEYRKTGIYRIFSSNLNLPISNPNGIMLCLEYASNVAAQLFINFDGQTYTRVLWYGTWNNWVKLSV